MKNKNNKNNNPKEKLMTKVEMKIISLRNTKNKNKL